MISSNAMRAAVMTAAALGFAAAAAQADECLDEGDKRTQTLSGLDRSIRQLQTQVDKNCE